MSLPRKYKKQLLLIIALLTFLFTNTSLSSYLPKEMQALILPSLSPSPFPSPSLQPTVFLPSTSSLTPYPPVPSLSPQQTIVTRIVDGDTIEIAGGQKLRYIGIDTPESVDPRRDVECFGKEASQRNKELVLNKVVTLEKDVNETDRFGRLLRYVFVDGVMINEQLVREGYADASSYPPDIKHQEQLNRAEEDARINKRGLWGTC